MNRDDVLFSEDKKADISSFLKDPSLFINRNSPGSSFNRHVLNELKDTSHPL